MLEVKCTFYFVFLKEFTLVATLLLLDLILLSFCLQISHSAVVIKP